MGEMNISSATASDLTNAIQDYSVDTATTDGASDQTETYYDQTNWTQYLGYYKTIPELAIAIDAKATWTVGKGYTADPETKFILDFIKGWGKDTFNTILENMIRTYYIGGDAFAEIIRDKEKNLINLKSLDPASIRIVVNKAGLIKRYEQSTKTSNGQPRKILKEDMFHLARNRVADEIHGVSVIPQVEEIILMRNEAMKDLRTVYHRFVTPRWIIKLDTDDSSKIAAEKAKWDNANAKGENMYIPMGSVEVEQMAVAPNSTLNPQPWIDSLNNYFYQAVGTPQIVVGGSGEFTEASAKIAYLAWQQNVEEEQLYIEEQTGMQLGLGIELTFPASLENELLSDNKKDGAQNIDASETTAGQGQ